MNKVWAGVKKLIQKLKTREGFIQVSVFIFMLGAYNIKHLASSLYMILFFISLYTLAKPIKKFEFTKVEKYVFVFIMIYFLWFIITSLIPGWGYDQTKRLEVELRFIFAIPIYILLRQVKSSLIYLWYGAFAALWLGFLISVYQVYVLHTAAEGGYGKLLIGPMSVLYVFIFLSRKDWAVNTRLKIISVATVVAGVIPVVLSGARTAYIMLVALFLVWVAINYSWRKKLILFAGLFFIIIGVYVSSNAVKNGVDRAVNGIVHYSERAEAVDVNLGSTETRLEMIKAAYIITLDNPIFGIGDGNFKKTSIKYIKAGSYHPYIGEFEHFHNIFADNSAKRGIPGLLLILIMFFVPLWYFRKHQKVFYLPATIGFYYIAGEILAGLTIVAPTNRGNFIAISMIVLSICLSEIIRYSHEKEISY